jgi:N-acetyl-anhydromuramyl-L-alanine amidase AmpD
MFVYTLLLFFQLTVPTVLNRPLPIRHLTIRDTTVNYIVLHNDGGTAGYNTARRTLIKRRLSYHYYIQANGTIVKLLDPKYEASHVGLSYWNGMLRINRYSIGICLENGISGLYTLNQYNSLTWLILSLQERFPDSTSRTIIGHSDVATPLGRKRDPGPLFDYQLLNRMLRNESLHRQISKE